MDVTNTTLDESKVEKKKKKKKQKIDEEAPQEPETPAAEEEAVRFLYLNLNFF